MDSILCLWLLATNLPIIKTYQSECLNNKMPSWIAIFPVFIKNENLLKKVQKRLDKFANGTNTIEIKICLIITYLCVNDFSPNKRKTWIKGYFSLLKRNILISAWHFPLFPKTNSLMNFRYLNVESCRHTDTLLLFC